MSKNNKFSPEVRARAVRLASMFNTAWKAARIRAGLDDLHVHDLHHTVGMRLRLASVHERTQDEMLWHSRRNRTSHYAVAQVREIYAELESIKEEGQFEESLNLLALVRRTHIRSISDDDFQVPTKSSWHKKTA